MIYPTWGAMPRQLQWHYWTSLGETVCGQRWFGGELEQAPADLTGQKLCKKCKAKADKTGTKVEKDGKA